MRSEPDRDMEKLGGDHKTRDLDRLYYQLLEYLSAKPLASTATTGRCDRPPP